MYNEECEGVLWGCRSAAALQVPIARYLIIDNPSHNEKATTIPFCRKSTALNRKCGGKRKSEALAREGGHAKRNPEHARELPWRESRFFDMGCPGERVRFVDIVCPGERDRSLDMVCSCERVRSFDTACSCESEVPF